VPGFGSAFPDIPALAWKYSQPALKTLTIGTDTWNKALAKQVWLPREDGQNAR
jgi:hypothetical protein